ncbi:hypothetical protein [Yersinia pseudotuberculosis]|uniref:hypothetical protein n=1 Tax=Yersinia pseudotuberculosis TaxID=633 RepID=UPI002B31FBE1|nr:Lambda phage lipoprotein [Yersinia pseudotuberculosis]
MRKIALLALSAALAGCATSPVATKDAKMIPGHQILNASITQSKENTGKVIIKRDSGFVGSVCLTRIFVDGNEVADLNTSEMVIVYPAYGEHIFSAWPKGICGGGMSEQSGNVTEGRALMYRIGYGTNGDFGLHPTAF